MFFSSGDNYTVGVEFTCDSKQRFLPRLTVSICCLKSSIQTGGIVGIGEREGSVKSAA